MESKEALFKIVVKMPSLGGQVQVNRTLREESQEHHPYWRQVVVEGWMDAISATISVYTYVGQTSSNPPEPLNQQIYRLYRHRQTSSRDFGET